MPSFSFFLELRFQIFVFEANGTLLFSGNYIDLIKDRTKVLDNVFVSEDGKDLLVNAGGKIYSFDMGSKNKKFESEIGGWALASNSSDGILAFKITVPNSEKGTYDFKVLSRSDGKTLDHLSGLKKIDFVKTGVLMSMDSDILEYAFI